MFVEATVVSATDVTPDCKQFVLSLPDEESWEGNPGNHTVIRRENGDARPYSVLTHNGNQAVFMIRAYDVNGVADYIHNQGVGDIIEVNPTLRGNLHLQNENRPIVLIGTGTGLTPLIGILHEYLERGSEEALFLFGEKNKEQLMYKAMLEQLEVLHPLEARFSLSREEWSGHEGYAQEQLDSIVADYGADADYYLCGVPPAVVGGKEKLRELGVPDERIHSEGWEESQVEQTEE